MIDCDPAPDPRLELKIAQTPQELQECFRLLHDAYVGSGFMKPDPSGMRVTMYHALPTTTTLAVSPGGATVEGLPVALTATVAPADTVALIRYGLTSSSSAGRSATQRAPPTGPRL